MPELADFDHESVVKCPGDHGGPSAYDHAHPTALRVYRKDDMVVVDASGVRIERASGDNRRGVLVEQDYDIECGHYVTVRQQFHKGQTFTETVVHGNRPVDAADGIAPAIWRD